MEAENGHPNPAPAAVETWDGATPVGGKPGVPADVGNTDAGASADANGTVPGKSDPIPEPGGFLSWTTRILVRTSPKALGNEPTY